MHNIPDEAVKVVEARIARLIRLGSTPYEVAKESLTAALPFLPVQGAVKKLEWTKGVVDIASPHPGMKYVACSTTPKGSWAFWLNDAPETRAVFTSEEAAKAAAQADYEVRILSALEPSAARELALEALRSAEQFIENGFEFGFIRKPDEGDPALETLPKIKAAIRALSSPNHADDLAVDRFAIAMKQKLAKKREEGRGGWENKDECSAEYLSYSLIQHIWKGDPVDVANFAMMLHQRGERVVIDSETSFIIPNHADAGKVEGDGWPTGEYEVDYEVICNGEWVAGSTDLNDAKHYAAVYSQDGKIEIVEARTYRRPIPSAPASEGA